LGLDLELASEDEDSHSRNKKPSQCKIKAANDNILLLNEPKIVELTAQHDLKQEEKLREKKQIWKKYNDKRTKEKIKKMNDNHKKDKEKRKEADKRYYEKKKREIKSKTKQPRGVNKFLDIDDLVGV